MDATESHDALAQLAWQVELGADEAILDAPVNRFDLPETARKAPAPAAPAPAAPAPAVPGPAAPAVVAPAAAVVDEKAVADAATALARDTAAAAGSLQDLQASLAAFEGCELRHGARNLVFSDGDARARVMVVGEAPGRDEDLQGKPFVGRAGQLLDAMFAAIGLSRHAETPEAALYITNMLPWRPPQNRDPTPEEIAILLPFVRRHVELADPEVLVLMGNWACQGLLGRRGIMRMRGTWDEAVGRPALPMFHPAFLLRQPAEKARAWEDLLSLKARLRGTA
ncbi:uracil-DNA glycosylase [Roseibacterium sp. SDUM158017]|uniref:uracil-DNA glycosylase n=1 Tax=Roseicyclus salinarum TaxID=3036773 RepID=UPI002414D152|nr:uracil-DNA glycosylase [Roseibacterium sp. SDUM158017]MDG4649853.1 uracil-DNA glycosylase [Roseibacterium sp. SDUM158017]